ncbi:MAG: hypothetical protein AAF560_15715 [Acidobacteriota bacterium]
MSNLAEPLSNLTRIALLGTMISTATPATASLFGSENQRQPPAVELSSDSSAQPEESAATQPIVGPVVMDFGIALLQVDRATIRQLAPFSSLVDIPWDHPELSELITYAKSYDMKALVSLHTMFFEHDESGAGRLRSDASQRWRSFVETHRESLGYGTVWAFYLIDEPFWNPVPLSDLVIANDWVKQSFPLIRTMTSMNRHDLENAPEELPPDLFDIAGYHAYALATDPTIDPEYQYYLRLLQEKFSGRDFVIVADAWWSSHRHGTAGIEPLQLVERAAQYRRVAEDIGAIALGAFVWQGLPDADGLRDLPEPVQREYLRVGSEISDRCGVPASSDPLAGENNLFLHDCRFLITVHWRDPDTEQQGQGVGVQLTKDSGVFWFFEPSNIELTVKLLDGRAHNDHWWVFWSHMTSLEVWLEVTDTTNGRSVRYFQPEADTAAFPEDASPTSAGEARPAAAIPR